LAFNGQSTQMPLTTEGVLLHVTHLLRVFCLYTRSSE